jgi:TonB family protein
MFGFDKSDFQRFAVSSVGAVAVSAACLFGAVAPAKAATPVTNVAAWEKNVSNQLSHSEGDDEVLKGTSRVFKVVLAARFTSDGDYAGAQLAQSSGNAKLDRHAVQVANRIAYPQLPAGYRGQVQTVTMRVFFGNDGIAVERAAAKDPVQFAFNTNAGSAGVMTAR